jgi:hypothetical protein
MTFRLTRSIPYEGDYSRDYETLEEVKEEILREKYVSLDDMDIIEYTRSIDVYDLMRDTK